MKKFIVFLVVFIFIISTIFVIADTLEKPESNLEKIISNDVSTSLFPPEPGKLMIVKPDFNVTISGIVKLPHSKVAPKGGLKVNIDAGINPNTMSYDVLRSQWPLPINSISILIPEGMNSTSYEIPVVNYYKLGNEEYKPWYALMFYYNYNKDSLVEYQGDFYKGPLDLSQGNLDNIDYTFESYNLN